MKPVPMSLMRERIEVQSRTTTQNAYGEPVATWSTLATVWARVEPLSGRELWQAAQVRPDVSHKVTMRHYPGLSPKHRLKLGSRIFNIDSVLNIEERERLHQVLCKEEV